MRIEVDAKSKSGFGFPNSSGADAEEWPCGTEIRVLKNNLSAAGPH
jgi:hypothetical protein